MPGERPGVDAADPDDALRGQPVLQRSGGAPVGRGTGRVAHHIATHPDPARLVVLAIDSGVTDVRRGVDHNLTVVRGVGQRLLIAGHAGGEDGLTEGLSHTPVGLAPKGPPILQHEDRVPPPLCHRTAFPSRTVGRPCRKVATTRAGSSIPAYGVLRLRLANDVGSTPQQARGSTRVRLPGRPFAGSWPWSVRPAICAGTRDIRSAMPSQPSSSASASTTIDSAVSNPSIPGRA